MKKIVKPLVITLIAILTVSIAVAAAGYGILSFIVPNPESERVTEVEATGYVRAVGKNVYDENGKLLFFKGVNFGNWFDQEYWMCVSSCGNYIETDPSKVFETGIYTQKRGLAAMRANPNLTEEQIAELSQIYIDNYIREEDFQNVAALNLNCIRINFTCYNLTTDGYEINYAAFDKLDWAIEMCERYHLYVILDYHGAIGSQNMDNHSGNDETFELYGNERNMQATVEIWETIAERYKSRYKSTIAAYDLLNEPRSAPGEFAGKVQFDFYDELYKAIRAIDKDRMLRMECFTFPTHGVNSKEYGWQNVCYSYHFYNLTLASEKFAVNFYRVLHNLMGYEVPIIVGEYSAWDNEKGWKELMDSFESNGWSYLSWTYKTNRYLYKDGVYFGKMVMWGLYELDIKPVNLYTATYEEIAAVWGGVGTENAQKTMIYDIFEERFASENQ
ncbi:MAG: cellulase family glycosylhydrolase [Clostridia bacterium]|nr:cellulase family glycosylhydrolase [Clostridia bacterium]